LRVTHPGETGRDQSDPNGGRNRPRMRDPPMDSDGADCGARARRSLERIQDLLNRDGRVAWAGLRPSDSRAVATGIRPPHSGCRKNVRIPPSISARFVRSHRLRPDSPKTYGNPVHGEPRVEKRAAFRRWPITQSLVAARHAFLRTRNLAVRR
jgi:hypothetical protein